MNCIVTGGAGFIGSNVVDALVARGDHVTVIDNLSTGKRSNLERAVSWRRHAGRRRRARCRRGRGDLRLGAARSRLPSRRSDRRPPFGRGPGGRRDGRTCSGRSGCSRRPARRARGGSSTPRPAAACTATPSVLPTPEDYPIRPLAPYGQGKYAAEGYCELYTRLHGLVDGLAPLRQRLRPAPGRARRGGRGRDLLRRAGRRAPARPCSETDGRRAIGSR